MSENQTIDRAPLFAALAKAQAAAKSVGKDSKNKHFGYQYASADDIAAAGREALSAHGLALIRTSWGLNNVVATIYAEKDGDGKDTETTYHDAKIVAHYLLTHESGASIEVGPYDMAVIQERGKPLDKSEAGALTVLNGYVVLGILCLDRAASDANIEDRDDRDYQPRQRATTAPARTEQRVEPALGNTAVIRNRKPFPCEGCGIDGIKPGEGWAVKEADGKWHGYCSACHERNLQPMGAAS